MDLHGAGPSRGEGRESPLTDDLGSASRNPAHFRSARRFLMAEGLVLIALGIAGMISSALHADVGPDGAPVLFLYFTPWHSGILLGFGILCAASIVRRHLAVAVTAIGAVGFALLLFAGGVAAAHDAPTPLGLDNRDLLLHGVIAIVNFAILYWLLPDVLEGRNWGPRSRRSGRSDSQD